jgi:cell division protein ZapA (FtsZ GTPase activity inhibitor)
MDSNIKVTVNIQGRVCSMNVKPEEERALREAARQINDKIAEYKQRFAKADPFDLLAITAIQFVAAFIESSNVDPIIARLSEVNLKLNEFIKE